MESLCAFSRFRKTLYRCSRAHSIRPCTGSKIAAGSWRNRGRAEEGAEGNSQYCTRQSESGREAKFYSLTKQGKKQLDTETENWTRLAEAIRLVMQTGR